MVTVRKIGLGILLLVIPYSPGASQTGHKEKTPELSLEVKLAQSIYCIGETVEVNVTLNNVGDTDVMVPRKLQARIQHRVTRLEQSGASSTMVRTNRRVGGYTEFLYDYCARTINSQRTSHILRQQG